MLDYDFENSAGFWIMTAAHDYERAFNDELAPEGITLRQCQVLGFLALAGPLAQNELAERMRIEPPTLVGILDRMERDGWIRRTACPGDRRRKLIQPQAAAKPVWERIVQKHGLQPYPYEQIAMWPFGDFVFDTDWDLILDDGKRIRAGFTEVIDTEERVLEVLSEFRAARIIP